MNLFCGVFNKEQHFYVCFFFFFCLCIVQFLERFCCESHSRHEKCIYLCVPGTMITRVHSPAISSRSLPTPCYCTISIISRIPGSKWRHLDDCSHLYIRNHITKRRAGILCLPDNISLTPLLTFSPSLLHSGHRAPLVSSLSLSLGSCPAGRFNLETSLQSLLARRAGFPTIAGPLDPNKTLAIIAG